MNKRNNPFKNPFGGPSTPAREETAAAPRVEETKIEPEIEPVAVQQPTSQPQQIQNQPQYAQPQPQYQSYQQPNYQAPYQYDAPVRYTQPRKAPENNKDKYTATMDRALRTQIKIACATKGIMFSQFIEDACREKLSREGVRK